MELIYIGTDESRFIRSNSYRVVSFTSNSLRILDKFGVIFHWSIHPVTSWKSDMIQPSDFITLEEYRNRKLESIGI